MTWLRNGFAVMPLLAMALGACGDNSSSTPADGGPNPDGHIVDSDGGGCPITISSPTGAVTTDADSVKTGVQANVVVTLGSACSGQAVTLSGCDTATQPLTVTAQGTTATFTGVTLCDLDRCPTTVRTCTAAVTSGGLTSIATAAITVDTQPPLVTVVAADPAGVCNGSVAADDDVDANTAGVQIKVRVLTVATTRWVETTPPGDGTQIPVDATGLATVTLAAGTNTIIAKATDANGLSGVSPACPIDLSNLRVTIVTPAAGAALGSADGTVQGDGLAVQVCGTVGQPTTSTVTITVDHAGATTATIDDTTTGHYCGTAVVPSGAHEIEANGSSTTGDTGIARVNVTVDVTAPPPPTGLSLTAGPKRNVVTVGYVSPTDVGGAAVAHCEVKRSPLAIPDAATFDALAVAVDVPGTTPGATQSTTVTPVQPGVATFYAVRCFDAAGNGSDVVSGGPVTTKLTQSAALVPVAAGGLDLTDAEFGRALAGADLNGDGFADLVVGAPGACTLSGTSCNAQGLVYIYMGSATGIATAPSFILRGTDAGGFSFLGKSIAVLDWNHDGVDDIAVGAPLSAGFAGTVFIWLGDDATAGRWTPSATATVLDDTSADVSFTPDQSDEFLSGTTELGWQVASGDFDGDGRDDLLIGATGAHAFTGGVVVVYGASGATAAPTGTIGLPAGLAAAGITARGYLFDSLVPTGVEYGGFLASLGRLGDGPTPAGDTRDDFIVAPVAQDFHNKVAVAETLVVFYGQPQAATPFTKVDAMIAGNELISGPIDMGADAFRFGSALGSISDQDGDGRREILIADPLFGFGDVWIVPGGIPGQKNIVDVAWLLLGSSTPGAGLGTALASPIDVDGDGKDDVVATANNGGAGVPTLQTWYSGTGKVNAFADTYTAPVSFGQGSTAAWVGDLNGDGLPDLAWADSRADEVSPKTGSVQVLY